MTVLTLARPQERETTPELKLEFVLMGFSVRHLEFYRWLVEHGRNPEYDDSARTNVHVGELR